VPQWVSSDFDRGSMVGTTENTATFDVVGVGNAIVDVLAEVEDAFIDQHSLAKGGMTLIEADRALQLHEAMPPGLEISGGSAANTMVGVAGFGGKAAYIGKVSADSLGDHFGRDLAEAGVSFTVPGAHEGLPTARCLIQVTPDAQRTMNTFLGVSSHLTRDDVDPELVASGATLYCEGYLWDREVAKDAIRFAMDTAREANRRVALTMSDQMCVDRHRQEWQALLDDRVDVVFANRSELCAFYQVDDLEEAVDAVASHVDLAFITLGPQGSLIVNGSNRIEVPADELDGVVDTTGAGDLYASGVLYGLSRGVALEQAGRLGSVAAAEVISHLGARPAENLVEVAQRIIG